MRPTQGKTAEAVAEVKRLRALEAELGVRGHLQEVRDCWFVGFFLRVGFQLLHTSIVGCLGVDGRDGRGVQVYDPSKPTPHHQIRQQTQNNRRRAWRGRYRGRAPAPMSRRSKRTTTTTRGRGRGPPRLLPRLLPPPTRRGVVVGRGLAAAAAVVWWRGTGGWRCCGRRLRGSGGRRRRTISA